MKNRMASVLLAATLALSSLCVANAAEEIPQEFSTETAAKVEAEGRGIGLVGNEKTGMFLSFGMKTIFSVTDENFNKVIVIPNKITVSDKVSVMFAMQNLPAFGITDQVLTRYNMNLNVGPIQIDPLMKEIKNFRTAEVNGNIGGKKFHYTYKGRTDANGTTIDGLTSDAAPAFKIFDHYLTPIPVPIDGIKMAKGSYIQIGTDRIEYHKDYKGDLVIGENQTSIEQMQEMVRKAFAYKQTAALPDAQIAVFLPKGSYLGSGGKAGALKEDMLIRISGLNDGYNIVNTDTGLTMLKAMYEATSSGDMLSVMLRSVNSLIAGANCANVNVDISFSGIPPAVQATGISLDKSFVSMETGDVKRLTAVVSPSDTTDKTVIWTSSNPGIVNVTGGRLTALKPGKVTITARTVNGKTASCTVEVTLSAPSGFKAVSYGPTSVRLSWEKVQSASKYQIYRAKSRDGKYKKLKTVTTNSYTDKKLKMGSKYYYKIRSVYGSVYSPYTEVRAAYARLQAPKVSLKAGKKTATVKWAKLKGASGYEVYYKRGENGAYRRAATLSAKKNSVKVKKLASRKVYVFKVRAYKNTKQKKYYGSYSEEQKIRIR